MRIKTVTGPINCNMTQSIKYGTFTLGTLLYESSDCCSRTSWSVPNSMGEQRMVSIQEPVLIIMAQTRTYVRNPLPSSPFAVQIRAAWVHNDRQYEIVFSSALRPMKRDTIPAKYVTAMAATKLLTSSLLKTGPTAYETAYANPP